jgi:DNA-nicking Smr family endonuclease
MFSGFCCFIYSTTMSDFGESEIIEPVEIPVDGTLDLHTFHPREVKELLPYYLALCREKGISEVRIIHGKGTGTLREIVHSALKRMPEVLSFRPAGENSGSWGATFVILKPLE